MIVIAIALVIVPLGITSYHVVTDDILRGQAGSALSTWLAGTDYEVITVSANDGHVDADIGGDGPLPPIEAFLTDLEDEGGSATVTVHVVPARTLSGSTNP